MRVSSVALALLLLVAVGSANMLSHKYKPGENVYLWVSTIGPIQNPHETYSYYNYPFCPAVAVQEAYYEGLGEALQGYDLSVADVVFKYLEPVAHTIICSRELTHKDAKAFKYAIRNNYWFSMFADDLPIWGLVGEVVSDGDKTEQVYLYTHKKYVVTFNQNRIIEVNLTCENPVSINEALQVSFSYSVDWVETTKTFEDRFDRYLDSTFFEHQIHWFSIFNSFMMVIFLTGLVTMILMRVLRQDFAKYNGDDSDSGAEDSGWKQIHWDVFRSPAHLSLFSALVGIGMHLCLLVLFVILLAFLGSFYEERGHMATAAVVCYAITSVVGGFVSGGHYSRNSGKQWIRTMLFTSLLFPGLCFIVTLTLNMIAVSYQSLASVSFTTMLSLFLIWAFVSFPLTLAGTVLGRNWHGQPNFPCRVAQVPRQIPPKAWYLDSTFQILAGGLLPFGSIFIEIYFVFTSFWHYKYYYVYGFMLLVFLILIVVTICVTIVSTYFLLNAEDWRWQWNSFLSSASISFYIFVYSVYYFFVKTKMTGFFQTAFYFGYVILLSTGISLLCASVGYLGTSLFVYKIFSSKMD